MSAAAGRRIAVPDGVDWRRMHPVSPLLEGWKVVTAVIAVLTVNKADNLLEAYRYATTHGIDLAHGVVRWVVVGSLAAIAAVVAFLFLRWWAKSYAVDRDGVYLRSGILIKQLRIARLPRIQSVDIIHPLLGRVFGLGQLTVEVAGGSDSRIVIGYLTTAGSMPCAIASSTSPPGLLLVLQEPAPPEPTAPTVLGGRIGRIRSVLPPRSASRTP